MLFDILTRLIKDKAGRQREQREYDEDRDRRLEEETARRQRELQYNDEDYERNTRRAREKSAFDRSLQQEYANEDIMASSALKEGVGKSVDMANQIGSALMGSVPGTPLPGNLAPSLTSLLADEQNKAQEKENQKAIFDERMQGLKLHEILSRINANKARTANYGGRSRSGGANKSGTTAKDKPVSAAELTRLGTAIKQLTELKSAENLSEAERVEIDKRLRTLNALYNRQLGSLTGNNKKSGGKKAADLVSPLAEILGIRPKTGVGDLVGLLNAITQALQPGEAQKPRLSDDVLFKDLLSRNTPQEQSMPSDEEWLKLLSPAIRKRAA